MTATAAEYMAQSLAQVGVKRIYGVVGDSLNGFTDALRRLKSIEWIQMRHEEGYMPSRRMHTTNGETINADLLAFIQS
jgi:glyoxylate carboligase